MAEAQPDLVVLHGRESSAALELVANEAPLWRYWGPRLSSGALHSPKADGLVSDAAD